jgi:hypothetical protein
MLCTSLEQRIGKSFKLNDFLLHDSNNDVTFQNIWGSVTILFLYPLLSFHSAIFKLSSDVTTFGQMLQRQFSLMLLS